MNNNSENKIFGKPINLIIGIAVIIIFIVGLLRLASFMFSLLSYITPVLVIAAAIIDHKVIVNYAKWLISLWKKDTLRGVLATIATVFGFPVVAAYFLVRALYNKNYINLSLGGKKQESNEVQEEGEYINFEELEEPIKVKNSSKDTTE